MFTACTAALLLEHNSQVHTRCNCIKCNDTTRSGRAGKGSCPNHLQTTFAMCSAMRRSQGSGYLGTYLVGCSAQHTVNMACKWSGLQAAPEPAHWTPAKEVPFFTLQHFLTLDLAESDWLTMVEAVRALLWLPGLRRAAQCATCSCKCHFGSRTAQTLL